MILPSSAQCCRTVRHWICVCVGFAVVAIVGCTPPAPIPKQPSVEPVELGSAHDPATTGTIVGHVRWNGDVPKLVQQIGVTPSGENYNWIRTDNPFAPQIDTVSHGLANALVYLKKVDPTRSKKWDWPPLRIEQRGYRIYLLQGDSSRMLGVVRTGEAVSMVSLDPELNTLRARGAAFFSLAFPEPNKPLSRKFDHAGVVELTSGAGYYWTAADVLVSEHPYASITDKTGRFELTGVPNGEYELVCRIRNWNVVKFETDPETGLIFRQSCADPLELTTTAKVTPQGRVEQAWTVRESQFQKTRSR